MLSLRQFYFTPLCNQHRLACRLPQVVHQVSGIRGEVLPAFSVANGAVLEPNFGSKPYSQGMPQGFQGIIKSMSLL